MRILKALVVSGLSEALLVREESDGKSKANAKPSDTDEKPKATNAKPAPKDGGVVQTVTDAVNSIASAIQPPSECQTEVIAMCRVHHQDDFKDLKRPESVTEDMLKQQCARFNQACPEKKDTAGDGNLPQEGLCAKKGETASFQDGWKVVDSFCNKSCGSC